MATDDMRTGAALARLDHLVYSTTDVEQSVDRLESLLGVRAAPGGHHPGRGTHNALLALSPSTYFEIIGPDPTQPAPAAPRWFEIDTLTRPRLTTWSVKASPLERFTTEAERHGIRLGAVVAGSRRRSDGELLRWRLTNPAPPIADGLVPFLIDWEDSPHPADSAPRGLELISLRAEHPEPAQVERVLAAMSLTLPITRGSHPRLIATLRSPRGEIELD